MQNTSRSETAKNLHKATDTMIVAVADMVADARRQITEWPIHTLLEALDAGQPIAIIDIRDVRELWREGKIPGASHCPRGMLEFWIDPQSPYHKPIFAEECTFVFYCASGWRSALATLTAQTMGLQPVASLAGGFTAWREHGGIVETVAPKS